MDRSTAFDFAGSIQRAAEIVTEGTSLFDSNQLAGQYAFDAAIEGSENITQIDADTFDAHLECLAEAGAKFDRKASLGLAMQFLAEHLADAE